MATLHSHDPKTFGLVRPSVVATGISINIGVNRVDPSGYGGWVSGLRGCENDAAALAQIAESAGFATEVLLTEAATTDEVVAWLDRAADTLRDGDFLLVSFSGYGGRIPGQEMAGPRSGDTWALYDRQLILEVELFDSLRRIDPGTRILVVADTCVQRVVPRAIAPPLGVVRWPVEKWLPYDVCREAHEAQRAVYDEIVGARTTNHDGPEDESALVMIHSCTPYQAAWDGEPHSPFTEGFVSVWSGGDLFGDYRQLQKSLAATLPPTQSPELTIIGERGAALAGQQPLKL